MRADTLQGSSNDKSAWLRGVFEQMTGYAMLSRVLRVLGAGVVTVSVSLFLFQGWESGNDIERYLLLLAQTMLLAGTGLLTAHVLKEYKGARLFLLLALAATTVNFTILGALIYSILQWDDALGSYPAFAVWQADSPLGVALVSTGAFILLAPAVYVAFLALSRRSSRTLSLAFLASNAMLLLPVRETLPISAVLAVSALVLLRLTKRMRLADPTLSAQEGMLSRALLFLPLVIMVGRGMYLYAADSVTITVLSAILFMVLRQISVALPTGSLVRWGLELLSLVPVLGVAIGLPWIAEDLWRVPDGLAIPLFLVAFSSLVLELSLRSAGDGTGYRSLAGAVTTLALLGNLALFSNLISASACLVLGMGVMAGGFSSKQQIVFALGLLSVLAGLLWQLHHALVVFDFSGWVTLALGGICTMLVASTLERHGVAIKATLARLGSRLRISK